MPEELIIATFQNETQADNVLNRTRQLAKEGQLELIDAAVIVKTQDNKVKVDDIGDVDEKKGAIFGAITGGLVGLIAGPIGAIVGAAAGSVTGRTTAKLADYGVSKEMINNVESDMSPGSSAIILYTRMNWVSRAISLLEEAGASVYHETVDSNLMESDFGPEAGRARPNS
ncbi:MAG: DUF1269 domain-containing protein [Anaerolineae bacterium]|nr:DUF1269 domain-containing protein [Anaerolineae bacterium]